MVQGFKNMAKRSLAGRGFGRVMKFGVLRGLRSVEVNPEDFRQQLANKHGLWVPNFSRMHDVPLERSGRDRQEADSRCGAAGAGGRRGVRAGRHDDRDPRHRLADGDHPAADSAAVPAVWV